MRENWFADGIVTVVVSPFGTAVGANAYRYEITGSLSNIDDPKNGLLPVDIGAQTTVTCEDSGLAGTYIRLK